MELIKKIVHCFRKFKTKVIYRTIYIIDRQ